MAIGLLLVTGGRARGHAAVWLDAPARVLHAVRWRAATREHGSGWISGGEEGRGSRGSPEIFVDGKPGNYFSEAGNRACQGGGGMATRVAEIGKGRPALPQAPPVTCPKP